MMLRSLTAWAVLFFLALMSTLAGCATGVTDAHAPTPTVEDRPTDSPSGSDAPASDAPASDVLAGGCNGLEQALCDALEQTLVRTIERSYAPGGLMAVSVDGQGTWTGAAGLSQIEGSVPMQHEMLFEIGSITKTFTGTAIVLLEEDGALSIEDTLAEWLPDRFENDARITLGHLLTHTSGIYSYTDAEDFDTTARHEPEELLAIARRRAPRFEPGTDVEYSNTGFILLGLIVEAASGMTWEEFVRSRLLQPLGLTDTYMDVTEAPAERMAHAYVRSEGADVDTTPLVDTTFGWAAGSMISSLRDLLRWGRALYAGEVLRDSSRDDMVTPWAEIDATDAYGLGAVIRIDMNGKRVGHDGAIGGYTTDLMVLPARGLAITNVITGFDAEEAPMSTLSADAWRTLFDWEGGST